MACRVVGRAGAFFAGRRIMCDLDCFLMKAICLEKFLQRRHLLTGRVGRVTVLFAMADFIPTTL